MSNLKTMQVMTRQAELAAALDEYRARGPTAFGRLWALVEGKVERTVEYYVEDVHIRDDLRQRVAYKFAERVRVDEDAVHNLDAYVRAMAHNECMTYHRECENDPLRSPSQICEFNEPACSDLSDKVQAAVELVQDLMQPLPEESKELLEMRYWQEKSAIEIGDTLDVSERRIHQILQDIYALLKRFFNADAAIPQSSATAKLVNGDKR